MSHSLAFGFKFVFGSRAFWVVFRVCPFGILTLLFEVTLVGMAPPSGLMKLLVAPESRTASFPIWYFTALAGSLGIFLNLSSLFNHSIVGLGEFLDVILLCWHVHEVGLGF